MASRPHKTVEEACFHVRSPAPSRKGFDCWVQGVADLSTTLDGKAAASHNTRYLRFTPGSKSEYIGTF